MHLHRYAAWVLLVAAGCTDRPAMVPDGSSSSGSSSGSGSGAPTTGGTPGTGSSGGETAGETTGGTSAGPTSGSSGGPGDPSSGGASSGGPESSAGETTGGAVTCGPPCDEPWEHVGDLVIPPEINTDAFVCLTRVVGNLEITGNADAAALHGLRNLREVESLRVQFNETLTDLSPFACLEHAHAQLSFYRAPQLVDASALAGLMSARYVSFEHTGLTAMPGFAPGFSGVENVYLRGNPALVAVDEVAGWGHTGGDDLAIQLDDNATLASVAGIGPLIEDAGDAGISIQITGAPALQSLAGLEPLTRGSLWLQGLTAVPDLMPLAGFTQGGQVTLVDMPAVTSLFGLHNLGSANTLVIGDCISNMDGTPGMDGLVDLSGLEALGSAGSLSIANNAGLTALTGAPLLTSVQDLNVIGNPMIAQADVDALVAQLVSTPDQCFGGWDECLCYEIMPW